MTTTPSGQHAPQGSGMDSFYEALRRIDVRRSDDGWIGGVCAGLAARLGVDPVIVRGSFFLLSVFFGLGVTVYLLAWLLVPQASTNVSHLERALRDGDGTSIALLVVTGLSLFSSVPFAGESNWGWGHGVGSLLLTALVLWGGWHLWQQREAPGRVGSADQAWRDAGSNAPPPPPGYATATQPPLPFTTAPPMPSTGGMEPDIAGRPGTRPQQAGPTAPVGTRAPAATRPPAAPKPPAPGVAVALVALGLALVTWTVVRWLALEQGWPGNPDTLAAAATLSVLGLLVFAVGLAGRRSGFAGGLASIALVATLVLAPLPRVWGEGSGDLTWTPTTLAGVSEFSHGVGEATLDLTGVDVTELEGQTLRVDLGVGDLTVLVPDDVTVEVRGTAGIGDVSVEGSDADQSTGGIGADETHVLGTGEVDLVLEAGVGIGKVTVRAAATERN